MCLRRTSPQRALITKEDITVYKLVDRLRGGKYGAEYQNFTYENGYHYTNDNFPLRTRKTNLLGEGMHSYKNRPGGSWMTVIKCYIPKGTPYYEGARGDIISRELVVVGQVRSKSDNHKYPLNAINYN